MSPIFPIAELDPRFRLYTAADAQVEFAVPFPWQNNLDIAIYRIDLDGVQSALNEAEHYQLTGAGSPTGGTLTLTEGNEALAGEQFLILGDVQLIRAGSIVQGGKFRSRSTDDDLDRMVLIAQEIHRELGRTLRTAYGVAGAEVDVGGDNVLPVWRAGRLEAGPVWGEELGIVGPGVAAGGAASQVLIKASGIDYDTTWHTLDLADLATADVGSVTTPAAADEVLLLETSVAGARKRWSLTNLQEWIRTKLGAMISASDAKSTPIDGDQIGISDSAASNGPAKVSFLNAWANYFKGKADAIYAINGTSNTHTAQQLELGHATDTTLSRSASGRAAVEGKDLAFVAEGPDLRNLGLALSVAGNALTIALKQQDGASAPSATSPVSALMRSATATSGARTLRQVTGPLSLTISSGSTLGHVSGVASVTYLYLIDNAGTLELAASFADFGADGIVSTTAEGGAGGADSGTVMYSASARSNVPFTKIGYTVDTQATAGTWLSVPSSVVIGCNARQACSFSAHKNGTAQSSFPSATDTKVTMPTEDFDIGGYYDAANSRWYPPPGKLLMTFTVRFTAGLVDQYSIVAEIWKNGLAYKQGAAIAASGTGANQSNNITVIAESTGSDYYEVAAYCGGVGTKTIDGAAPNVYFMGQLLPPS